MARDARADDRDALIGVVGDDVAGYRGVGAGDVDTVVTVSRKSRAGAGGADPVVGDGDVVCARLNLDPIAAKTGDHQAANRAAVPRARDRDAGESAAVSVQTNDRCGREIRLSRPIDNDGIGERQC